MEALVSIVVPVYNGMPHLRDLVDSILAQTHANLDIVFSEGGSTDDSSAYLATLTDPRIRVIQGGKGAAANWTDATNAARADYIKLVCQDDVLNPDAIAQQLSDLESHPTAVMAIAQRDIIDAKGEVLYAKRGLAGLKGSVKNGAKGGPNVGTVSGADLIRTCYLQGTNVIGEPVAVMFRATALKQTMPWDDSNPLMLDLSTYEKVATMGTVVTRHESIGGFRVSTSSWSTRLATVQLHQTKQWQDHYAAIAQPAPTGAERTRAMLGRHTQTMLRRAAYTVLKFKGSFHTTG